MTYATTVTTIVENRQTPGEIRVLLTKLGLEFCCFLRPGLPPRVEKSLDTKWFQPSSNGLTWRQGVHSLHPPSGGQVQLTLRGGPCSVLVELGCPSVTCPQTGHCSKDSEAVAHFVDGLAYTGSTRSQSS